MKTYTAIIYHCIACGRLEHTDMESATPQCCGSEMTKAAAETIRKPEEDEPASTNETVNEKKGKRAK